MPTAYHWNAVGWARDAARSMKLPPTDRLVLIEYAAAANSETGCVWRGIPGMCEQTGLGRSAITAATARLIKAGLLIPAGRKGKTGQVAVYLLAGYLSEWKAAAVIPVPGETYRPPAAAAEPTTVKPVVPGAAQPGFLAVEETGIDPNLYSPPETADKPDVGDRGRSRPLTARERQMSRWGYRMAAKEDGKGADGFYRDEPAGPAAAAEPPPATPAADDRVKVRRVLSGVYPADHAKR